MFSVLAQVMLGGWGCREWGWKHWDPYGGGFVARGHPWHPPPSPCIVSTRALCPLQSLCFLGRAAQDVICGGAQSERRKHKAEGCEMLTASGSCSLCTGQSGEVYVCCRADWGLFLFFPLPPHLYARSDPWLGAGCTVSTKAGGAQAWFS